MKTIKLQESRAISRKNKIIYYKIFLLKIKEKITHNQDKSKIEQNKINVKI